MNMDIVGKSASLFRAADSNPGAVTTSPGGVGRNIAENLRRLGFEVELITVVGDDGNGGALRDSCADLGLGLTHALRATRAPTSVYLCLLDHDGRLAGAIAAMEAMEELLPSRLEERREVLDSAACIVVDANIPEASIAWIAARYRGIAAGARPLLVLDPVSVAKAKKAAAHIGAFDLAKPNLAEARILAGKIDAPRGGRADGPRAGAGLHEAGADEDEPAELAAELIEGGLGAVHISLGAYGMYYDESRQERKRGLIRLPSPLPAGYATRNVSGAGDAACAALVSGALMGMDAEDSSRSALAAAILAAAVDSTVNPRLDVALLEETAAALFSRPSGR
jgi:pseudouridine kinase